MRIRYFHPLLLTPVALALSIPLAAQTVTGAVTGNVTDPSGAVIPKATVIATNVATNVQTPTVTNGAGAYTIRFLPIGQYTITVTAPGFGTYKAAAFPLQIDETAKVDAHLTAGAQTTVISVQGNVAPLINTTDGAVGLTLDAKQISVLPLNGENFSSITLFEPGAVNTDPSGLVGNNAIERNTYNNGIVAVNGNRDQANNYTLDGIDINEGQNNLIGYSPSPEALAQIKTISANAPASYGNVNGGDVVAVLKSGTNHLHGSAFGNVQDQNLNANSWSNKHFASAADRQPITDYTQSIFGGTIGGPILRDKLFFFVDYIGTRRHSAGSGLASVLTAAMRQGDFSELLTNSGLQLYNTQLPTATGGFTPYANNQVPVTNPVAAYLFAHPQYYPLPNISTPTDGLIQNNYAAPTNSFVRNDQGDVKIEWDAWATNKITAFYGQSDASDGSTAVLPISFPSQNSFPTKLFGADWIHTFSAAIVNDARIGFTRVRWDDGVPTDPTGAFGLTGDQTVGIPFGKQAYVGFSGQSISNNASYVGTPAAPQILRDNTFSYIDALTWQRGNHLLSFGVQAMRYQQNYQLTGAQGELGQFNYSGVFTGNGTANGYGAADFVLDQVASESIALPGGGLVGNRQWRTAGYVQDDWKATPKLTLNLGLRYEYDQRWNEVHNRLGNVILSGAQMGTVEYAGSVPTGAPAGSIVCPNISCYHASPYEFQPRFGFAYQLQPRWVLRGGYGTTSFFEGDANNQRLTYLAPFLAFAQPQAATPNVATATTPYSGGTPYAASNGFSISSSTVSNQGAGFGAWPQNIQPAYLNDFNLTTEYQLGNHYSISIAYVGETGQHLADYRNGNQLTLQQASAIAALPSGAAIPVADQAPFYNLVGQGGPLLITESDAMMNYNAAEVTVQRRAAKDFSWTVNYTYGRAMTNSAGNYTFSNTSVQNGSFQNGYDGHADYGPSGSDVRNNLSALGNYILPFGRGQHFGSNMNRVLDLIAGGWQLSASVVAYSGLPVTISGPNNTDTNTDGGVRANQYRQLHIVNRSIDHWFGTDPSATPCTGSDDGTCAYGPAADFTFGTAAVGSERTPGYVDIDTSFFKDFHITDSQSVGFRVNAYNVGNIASYDNPDSGISDPSFGQITSTRSISRIIEFSANYHF